MNSAMGKEGPGKVCMLSEPHFAILLRRLRAFTFSFAVLFIVLLLANHQLKAQCVVSIGGGIGISPPFIAHVGDTITISSVDVFAPLNSCTATNVTAWVIYPNGGIAQWLTNASLAPNSSIICPGSGACLAFPLNYVVQSNDVARAITFQTNLQSGNSLVCNFAGQANAVRFAVGISGRTATDPASFLTSCQFLSVRIVSPGIGCTSSFL